MSGSSSVLSPSHGARAATGAATPLPDGATPAAAFARRREQAPRHRLGRQRRMDRRADRDHGEAGLVLALGVVEARLGAAVFGRLRGADVTVRRAGEADAGGAGQREDRDGGEGRAGRRHAPARAGEQPPRQGEQGVADDAAEAARQAASFPAREGATPARRRPRRRRGRGPSWAADRQAAARSGASSPRKRAARAPRCRRGRATAWRCRRRSRPACRAGCGPRAFVAWLRLGSATDQVSSARPSPVDAAERREARELGRAALRKLAHRRRQIVENRERRRAHGPTRPLARRDPRAPRRADPMQIELMRA